MDITKQENLITKSRRERDQLLKAAVRRKDSPFNGLSIKYGLLAGGLMGLFLAFGGFYITGDQAVFGFAKYLILAAILGMLLNKVKVGSPDGYTFKDGISYGFTTTVIAAVTTALITLLVQGMDDTFALQPYLQAASETAFNSFVLAGIVFFEGLVAGLILTFIWLQLLKDRKPAV